MLRRKLFMNLGPLVALLLITAVAAIVLLQGVLRDLNHVNTQAWGLVQRVNELSVNINIIEVKLYEIQLGKERHLDTLIDLVGSVRATVQEIGNHHATRDDAECKRAYEEIRRELPRFEAAVAALATTQDPQLARLQGERALTAGLSLRQTSLPLSQSAREHAHADQEALSSWLRGLVLGLAAVFLVVINVAVIVLLRMGAIVVRPVDQLLVATRELQKEHFNYRVQLEQRDEFDDLARAFNSLAQQLETNEQKRIETLGQAAVTMNHELNNAVAIIDMQLAMVSRQTSGNPNLEQCLHRIQESLQRITNAVQSLKNVRRIILTDYTPGTKMLDLQQSVAIELPSLHKSEAN
ncbi:MAG TPA: HAMP domain-containing protein [Tepidisphaeraceae bacterium]|nr:HAMP domain-containing protein [Tepidisphaeraceae bacterium]